MLTKKTTTKYVVNVILKCLITVLLAGTYFGLIMLGILPMAQLAFALIVAGIVTVMLNFLSFAGQSPLSILLNALLGDPDYDFNASAKRANELLSLIERFSNNELDAVKFLDEAPILMKDSDSENIFLSRAQEEARDMIPRMLTVVKEDIQHAKRALPIPVTIDVNQFDQNRVNNLVNRYQAMKACSDREFLESGSVVSSSSETFIQSHPAGVSSYHTAKTKTETETETETQSQSHSSESDVSLGSTGDSSPVNFIK